jgi:hypothetical protein
LGLTVALDTDVAHRFCRKIRVIRRAAQEAHRRATFGPRSLRAGRVAYSANVGRVTTSAKREDKAKYFLGGKQWKLQN